MPFFSLTQYRIMAEQAAAAAAAAAAARKHDRKRRKKILDGLVDRRTELVFKKKDGTLQSVFSIRRRTGVAGINVGRLQQALLDPNNAIHPLRPLVEDDIKMGLNPAQLLVDRAPDRQRVYEWKLHRGRVDAVPPPPAPPAPRHKWTYMTVDSVLYLRICCDGTLMAFSKHGFDEISALFDRVEAVVRASAIDPFEDDLPSGISDMMNTNPLVDADSDDDMAE